MAECLDKIKIELKDPIQDADGLDRREIYVSCGSCVRCLERRKAEWGFRMAYEMEHSKCAYFVTLTYAPETVPYTNKGHKTLVPEDLTKFFKRLRQNEKRKKSPTWENVFNNLCPSDKIKYYAAGEYGESRGRPHYHAIIFNASARMIEKSWDKGQVHCVKANEATIAYTMKYLDKRYGKKQDTRKAPEFQVMSEGIGKGYIDKMRKWHKANLDSLYVTNKSGIKVPMPKYYRDKIFTDDERKEIVRLVSNEMDRQLKEAIGELGVEDYHKLQKTTRKQADILFRKKIKKRTID